MADIIIENGYVLTMDSANGDIEKGVVVIEDGRIIEIGESTGRSASRTIDAGGCVVMPGLVNTHGHLAMTLLRGYADDMALHTWLEDHIWPAESRITDDDVYLGSLVGCLEMIKSGTTAFADMYFHMDRTARAVEESGLRAALSYGMIDLGDKEKADSELEEGIRFVGAWNGKAGGRISTMYGPHAPTTCSREFLERIRDRAAADGVGIQIHILETRTDREAIESRYTFDSVRLLDELDILGPGVLAAHCIWLDDEDIRILADRGVNVSHNPVSNMKLASGIAPVAKMIDAGIPVSLGTDGCASNNNLDLFEDMKIAALLQKVKTGDPTVLPARRILEMATVNGAKALGIDGGILREGRVADVIVVDMKQPHLTPVYDIPSQLVYAARGSDVVTTIVDGTVLMENRRIVGLDEEEILGNASGISGALKK